MKIRNQPAGLRTIVWLLLALVTTTAAPAARGQTNEPTEADQLREELRVLQQDYEQRMRLGGNDYMGETAGCTFGVQMEAWW